ncbi:unnamed protein product [Prorocentrum cordatum]|uniref:Uncharacterized protein n=1 Tax=Prorocentrum cordatum TaxID=2364126 RepID=A0ABN9SU78_9DINO|nr:unnamed protein product [Polarella glacialis]
MLAGGLFCRATLVWELLALALALAFLKCDEALGDKKMSGAWEWAPALPFYLEVVAIILTIWSGFLCCFIELGRQVDAHSVGIEDGGKEPDEVGIEDGGKGPEVGIEDGGQQEEPEDEGTMDGGQQEGPEEEVGIEDGGQQEEPDEIGIEDGCHQEEPEDEIVIDDGGQQEEPEDLEGGDQQEEPGVKELEGGGQQEEGRSSEAISRLYYKKLPTGKALQLAPVTDNTWDDDGGGGDPEGISPTENGATVSGSRFAAESGCAARNAAHGKLAAALARVATLEAELADCRAVRGEAAAQAVRIAALPLGSQQVPDDVLVQELATRLALAVPVLMDMLANRRAAAVGAAVPRAAPAAPPPCGGSSGTRCGTLGADVSNELASSLTVDGGVGLGKDAVLVVVVALLFLSFALLAQWIHTAACLPSARRPREWRRTGVWLAGAGAACPLARPSRSPSSCAARVFPLRPRWLLGRVGGTLASRDWMTRPWQGLRAAVALASTLPLGLLKVVLFILIASLILSAVLSGGSEMAAGDIDGDFSMQEVGSRNQDGDRSLASDAVAHGGFDLSPHLGSDDGVEVDGEDGVGDGCTPLGSETVARQEPARGPKRLLALRRHVFAGFVALTVDRDIRRPGWQGAGALTTEAALVAASVAWCGAGSSHGLGRLSSLLTLGLLADCLFPEPSELCRSSASPGLALGTLVLPTLFAVQADVNVVLSVIAAIGVNNWGASLGLAACAAGVSTAKTRAVSHSLSWGLHIGALGALAVYVFARTPGDRVSSHPLIRWAPFVLVVLGSLMVLLDLTRHVLLDQNIAPVHLHMYNKDGSLTAVGEMGMYCTWCGVVLLVIGTGWFLNYQDKIASLYQSMFGKAGTPAPAAPEERA